MMTKTTTKTKPLECSICLEPIRPHPINGWAYGNNAQPINDGRCCDDCDALIVIPTRLRRMMAGRDPRI